MIRAMHRDMRQYVFDGRSELITSTVLVGDRFLEERQGQTRDEIAVRAAIIPG